jgi:branched-chain amino acid transport system substrate-binding protein
MKKKQVIAMLMAGAMCFGLMAGCSGTGSGSSDSGSTESAASSDAGGESEAPSGTAGGTFKLGHIGPLTGDAAIYGIATNNGAQLAVEEINALGGDIQFELKSEDDVATADTAVNAYNSLKDWGMQALIGCTTTGSAIAVAAEAYSDRVFAITPSASSTDVTAGKDNVFQVCFTDPNQGVASADYMAEKMADAKIAIIYRNDDAYSQGIRDAFKAEAEAKGLNIVSEGTFTKDTATDFSVQLTAAQSAGADLIFLPIYYQPASVIFNQADAMGYAPTFFGVDGMDGILTLEGFDTKLAEGVMLLTPFSASSEDEATQAFVSAYVEKFGETPNQFAADAYDAVYALYEAIKASGVTADMSTADICEALVAAMPTITLNGLTGTLSWSANGEVSKAPSAYVIQDGKYVVS